MIDRIIAKRSHDLGGGLTVGRVLPFHAQRMVGPYIFFDHLGPVDLPPGFPRELDVRPHPLIGLATVTYLYDGAITHRDSEGYPSQCRKQIGGTSDVAPCPQAITDGRKWHPTLIGRSLRFLFRMSWT